MSSPGGVHRPNFGLDLVRSFAILAVLFSHTADWFLGAGRQTDILAAIIGGGGVEVFFSLSGFLIGSILLRAQSEGLGPRGLARFWGRRWLRTLPAYWTMLLLLGLWSGVRDWRSMIFIQNFWPMRTWMPLTPHTWSLVLEEWFYLFVPMLVLAVQAALPVRLRRWTVPLTCLLLLAACTALRASSVLHPDPAFWGEDLAINPLLRLDCCVWGVLAACWVARRPALSKPAAAALVTFGAAGLLLCGIVSFLSYTPDRLVPFGVAHWGLTWAVTRVSLIEAAAVMVLLGLRRLLPHPRLPGAGAVHATASHAYALYLVHVPVLYLGRLHGVDIDHAWPPRLVMSAAVVAVAIAMRLLVERPVLALRDRLVPDAAAPSPQPGRLRQA